MATDPILFAGTPDTPVDIVDGPAPVTLPPPTPVVRPKLMKRRSFQLDKDAVVQSVIQKYDDDLFDRADWSEARLQRYAKFRGWLEPKQYPWPNASNAHIPLLMTDSMRTQDTLHNAVLAIRPVMGASATERTNKAKEEDVDNVLDTQLFREQNGEEKIGDLIDGFTNDGTFVAYIPWIRDERLIPDVRVYPPVPPEMPVELYVQERLMQEFPQGAIQAHSTDPFTFDVYELTDTGKSRKSRAEFSTDEQSRVVMVVKRPVVVYEGPCIIPKSLEDVVVPSRSSNLQPPGPSNPGGAPHVILVDYPTKDEIRRLRRDKVYDLMTAADLDALETHKAGTGRGGDDPNEHKVQKDAMAGQDYGNAKTTEEQITRLICFDRWDVDGDGLEEDVVFWVLLETKTLLRARYLTELYPSYPPRRPFAEARMLPVPGEFYGIGMLEMMEHLHDTIKVLIDQAIDKNTMVNTPWFGFRAASGVRPEVIRMAPGEGYPMSDPTRDIHFPQIPNPDQSFTLNLLTMFTQFAERQSLIGELQLGRVPYGKASALRTAAATQSILQQGDARPERILRRFFRGLSEVYQQMHELNQAFLPPKKQYRIAGVPEPGTDPYRTLDDPTAIRGRFEFDFKANVMNTSRAVQSQIMQGLAGTLINALTMQLGIVDPAKIYTILRDLVKSQGQDPDKYMNRPPGFTEAPSILAEEAMLSILNGQMPQGAPMEGAQAHLQKLLAFQQDDRFGLLTAGSLALYKNYLQQVALLAQQQAQQQAILHAAQQFSQRAGQQQGQPGQSSVGPQMGQPAVEAGELLDESLPTAGGGASGT